MSWIQDSYGIGLSTRADWPPVTGWRFWTTDRSLARRQRLRCRLQFSEVPATYAASRSCGRTDTKTTEPSGSLANCKGAVLSLTRRYDHQFFYTKCQLMLSVDLILKKPLAELTDPARKCRRHPVGQSIRLWPIAIRGLGFGFDRALCCFRLTECVDRYRTKSARVCHRLTHR